MYYKHLLNLIIHLKLLTFSLYIHCYWGKCSKCPLHVSQLVSKWRSTFIRKSKLFWWMWLVQSVFERADVIGRLTVRHHGNPTQFSHVNWCEKFQAWIACENFHTWNRCEFSIRHVQPCSTCEILNLHTLQTCFWCESGMKQAWSYENILYWKSTCTCSITCL